MSGDLLDRIVGDIGDDHAGSPGGIEIDVVYPDAVASDDLAAVQTTQSFRVPGKVGIEDGVGIGCDFQHGVYIAGGYDELRVDFGQHGALQVHRWEYLIAHYDFVSRHLASFHRLLHSCALFDQV